MYLFYNERDSRICYTQKQRIIFIISLQVLSASIKMTELEYTIKTALRATLTSVKISVHIKLKFND